MNTSYLFTSQRLGFRNWRESDIHTMFIDINSDDDVMEFFPFMPSREQTKDFVFRMQQQYHTKGFCYFAVDILETNEFIGFIGLSEQSYLNTSTPFVDIGWRLKKNKWNKGYATEGAKACLNFGFQKLGLTTIYSVASVINIKSEKVMQKIGMQKIKNFNHPKLTQYKKLESCVLYSISL